jgi:hypothetical protein
MVEYGGRASREVSPISPISFDQAIEQLELDLGLKQGPIDFEEDVFKQELQQEGLYGPVANSYYSHRPMRYTHQPRSENYYEISSRKRTENFSEITPLFHSNSQHSQRSRLSVDGANLEQISDAAQPLSALSQTMRYSAPEFQTTASPGSISLQRSKMANFNRRAPRRLQNRRLSQRTVDSPMSDATPETPTTPPYQLPPLRASPQQLPRLVIPKSKRPPVEVTIEATIEDVQPVPELSLDTPSSPVQDYTVNEASPPKLLPELELSGGFIDLEDVISGTEEPTEIIKSTTQQANTQAPLTIPTIIEEPSVIVSPTDTEVFFTISDYYTNDSPFDAEDFYSSPLGFLARKESYPTYSPFPTDDQASTKQDEMNLRDWVKEILRRSESQKRTTNIWSRRSSDTSKASPVSESSNGKWGNRSVNGSLPPTPPLDSGRLTSIIPERTPSPFYRDCQVCGDLYDVASYHSNPTAHCRHDPTTCPSCLSSWIRAQIQTSGTQNIRCPNATCRELLTAEDVHAVANPATIEL